MGLGQGVEGQPYLESGPCLVDRPFGVFGEHGFDVLLAEAQLDSDRHGGLVG